MIKKILFFLAIAIVIISIYKFSKKETMLTIGDRIPNINLKDENNNMVDIDSISSPMVIYFYPKDNTPGCIKEACSFRDAFEQFSSKNIRVFGISGDSPSSHKKFKQKYHLPFTLLSDTGNKIREKFGVPNSLLVLPGRVTFVVDKNKIIQYYFNSQFKASEHVIKALNYINK